VSAVLGAPEKNDALLMLLKREAEGAIPAEELLRIASGAEWNETPVDDDLLEKRLFQRLDGLGLSDEWATVHKNAEPKVTQAIVRLLSEKRFEASPVLTAAAIGLFAEPVVQGGALKDVAIAAEVKTALADTSHNEQLTTWLKLEARRPLPADELRKIVATTPEWRPKVERPVRSVVAKAPAKKAAAKKVTAKKAAAKTPAKKAAGKTARRP
jgi:hypothetical protein